MRVVGPSSAQPAVTGRFHAVLNAAPMVAFLLSGASGLVFQTIWSRLLHHVFGSSSVAISSVVSAFMGGLSLGAYLFGRMADRVKRPLLWYAAAEALVGLFAFAVPYAVRPEGPLASANAWLRASFSVDSEVFLVARFLCIVPLLIVPTTLMGATLPLLSRHVADRVAGASSRHVGRLYAVNTVGAVFGVLVCGFYLMPTIGVHATNTLAACVNLLLAAIMFIVARLTDNMESAPRSTSDNGENLAEQDSEHEPVTRAARIAAALAFSCSGMAALTYEVVFSRALINTIGGSVYSFALILATFLVGIAGGSGWASSLLLRATPKHGQLTAWLASVLSILSALTTAMNHGPTAWAIQAAACVAFIVYLYLQHRRDLETSHQLMASLWSENQDLGAVPRTGLRYTWMMLLVPLVSALFSLGLASDKLSAMMLSALAAMVSFFGIVLFLRARPLRLLAALQGLIALSTLASDLWADRLSIAFASGVTPFYDSLPDHVGTVMALMSLMSALCVLPAALAMGAMFPVTLSLWSRGRQFVGRDVGLVYTGNTVGSIVGAWLPGFVLMPAIGMQQTLHTGMALNLGLAAMLGVACIRGARPWQAGVAALTSSILCLYVLSGSPLAPMLRWNISKMTLGAFRISLAKDVVDEESWGAPELVYYRDGLSTTVTVERWGRHYSLKNNGKVDASSGDDMPTQIMVSAFPLMLHRRGPWDLDVAIIGFGSGATVGAALQFPVRKVTTVELERGVVEASRFFAIVNHLEYVSKKFPYVREPRLTVIGDDGRNHLAATPERYDVIVSEPSNPWLTGVSDLFTVEHFRISKKRLKPGGVYCQWVQLYEMSPENVKVIYRTFASHFRYVRVFSAEELSSDTVLVGSDDPLTFDLPRLGKIMADKRVKAELSRAFVKSPQDAIARTLLSSRDEIMRYTQVEKRWKKKRWVADPQSSNAYGCPKEYCQRQSVVLNSDDNAHIEFAAPKDLIGFERYRGYLASMYAPEWPYGRVANQLVGLPKGVAAAKEYAMLALSLLAHGRVHDSRASLNRAQEILGAHTAGEDRELAQQAVEVAGDVVRLLIDKEPLPPPTFAEPMLDGLSDSMARALHAGFTQAVETLARGDIEAAFHRIHGVASQLREHGGPSVRYLDAYLAYRAGRPEVAVEQLQLLAQLEPEFIRTTPEVLYTLARAHYARHHFTSGVHLMETYVAEIHARQPSQAADEAALPATVAPALGP